MERIGWVCAPATNETITAGDCDDADPDTFPSAVEQCDSVDNDCNGRIDEGVAIVTRYEDLDGDGFGGDARDPSCAAPGPDEVTLGGDCDDDDADVNPSIREICNGVDDDCDRRTDDDDDGVDPTTAVIWYQDNDNDDYGNVEVAVSACEPPGPAFILVGEDCDDGRPGVNPGGSEICNLIDDDCDAAIDDDDLDIDPSGQTDFFVDADLDGYGDPDTLIQACRVILGAVTNGDDCDDTEPTATVIRDWFEDGDGDGVGAGPAVANDCHSPGPDTVPGGDDCDDANPLQFPGNPEVCEDGFDQDCSGEDRQCATWLYAIREWDDRLMRYDILTSTLEEIGPLDVFYDYGDLAYDPESQTMYMIDGFAGGNLYTVDLLTGAATLVGTHGIWDLFGLAWDPGQGKMYAAESQQFGLWELDPATATPTFIGAPSDFFGALTWDASREKLIGVTDFAGILYELDTTTGASTWLANLGWVSDSGVAWEPDTDLYWNIDLDGTVFTVDPNDNYIRTDVTFLFDSFTAVAYVADPPN